MEPRGRHFSVLKCRIVSKNELTYTRQMFRLLKITLLWLVMIALPTQGFASAIMIDCGESHHHGVSSSAAAHDHMSHRHVGQPADHHDDGGQVATADHEKGGGSSHSLLGKCSACASCCLGTVAFNAVNVSFTPEAVGLTTTLTPEKSFTVNFPDGLERPPHTLPL